MNERRACDVLFVFAPFYDDQFISGHFVVVKICSLEQMLLYFLL